MDADWRMAQAGRQIFVVLRIGFVAVPILFGLDKFFNWSVEWPTYLAAWVNDIAPGSGQQFMYGVGVIEIAAGLAVALVPRFGAPLVAAWLFGIVINLLTVDPPRYYDIALRDFGLLLASLALTRLAWAAYSSERSTASVAAVAPCSSQRASTATTDSSPARSVTREGPFLLTHAPPSPTAKRLRRRSSWSAARSMPPRPAA